MNHTRLTAGFIVSLATIPIGAQAQQPGGSYYGPHMMWEGGLMFMGPLVMIALVVIVVAAVVLLIRRLDRRRTGTNATVNDNAAGILNERFARGEIDTEEYEARRRVLREN